jgi:hypothetical protein
VACEVCVDALVGDLGVVFVEQAFPDLVAGKPGLVGEPGVDQFAERGEKGGWPGWMGGAFL